MLTHHPIALVARGTLAPKYLRWVREHWADSQIHVINFSRWRYFDGVGESPCRWVTPSPAGGGRLVVFDRSITTGLTYRYLDKWFAQQGIETVNLGELDAERCKFGIRWVDYVWESGQVIPKNAWLESHVVGGEYTIGVFGEREELARFPKRELRPGDFGSIARQLEHIPQKGNVILTSLEHIDLGMLAGYVLERPLITVAGDGVNHSADFEVSDGLEELVEFLDREGVV